MNNIPNVLIVVTILLNKTEKTTLDDRNKKEHFMKKLRVFSVLMVCLLALSLVFTSCEIGDKEENDLGDNDNGIGSGDNSSGSGSGGNGGAGSTRNNAMAVMVGNSSSHTISLNGEHWFKYETTGNPVIFETTGNVVDTYIEVYRDGNTTWRIEYDDNSGEGSNALVSWVSTTAGTTYFIRITTRSQTSGTYSFVLKQPTANIRTNPITVSSGNSSSHIINASSTHWFRFEGTGDRVFFETESNVVKTSMSVFAGDNTSSSYSNANPISLFTVSGTTYYISITGNAGTYTFNVRHGAGDGSSRYNAKTVAAGNSTSHDIRLNGEHWFIFFGTGNPVTFKTTGNVVDTYIEVYRDGNTTWRIEYDDNSGEGSNALISWTSTTSGSTYFIKITQRQSTQGAYTFVVE